MMKLMDDGGDNKIKKIETNHSFDIDLKHVNWVEIIYSTIVESFSVMDLYTDILIFIELLSASLPPFLSLHQLLSVIGYINLFLAMTRYHTNNPYWATIMALLLCAPYLVSYCCLSTLLSQKVTHFQNSSLFSIFVLMLMTPLSVLYLVLIDLMFMAYSLSSTFIFMLCGCRPKYDIKDLLDEYLFNKILRMNRTEVIGYRRLRTLSQLCWETIPQILLQCRILYALEVEATSNQFQIDIGTLIWSIALGVAHLVLEGGVVWLDSKTLRMQFIQYAMTCLGGRVQWVPYQHFLQFVVKNQMFIDNVFDFHHSEQEMVAKQQAFGPSDALDHYVHCITERDLVDGDEYEAKNRMALSYEDIERKVLGSRYEIVYQFSDPLMRNLSELLINSSAMIIPKEFKLSTTNTTLQSFFRTILCRAELHLGYESCGNINIDSFCELYKSSFNKLKLNITKIDSNTVSKMKRNSGSGSVSSDETFRNTVVSSLIFFGGELSAIEWVYDVEDLPVEEKEYLLRGLLESILPLPETTDALNLVILRNCFKNHLFIAAEYSMMGEMKETYFQFIDQCSAKCEYDGSWCFVLIMMLFYGHGTVFHADCIKPQIKELFKQYLPSFIAYRDMLIPFEIFECCRIFKYYKLEEILVNRCKDWIILYDDSSQSELLLNNTVTVGDPSMERVQYQYLGERGPNGRYNKMLKKMLCPEIDLEDVALCDAIFYEMKLRDHISYLHKTAKYRTLINSQGRYSTDTNQQIRFRLSDLIPEWTDDPENDERHQIYQIVFHCSEEKESGNIEQIYFENVNEDTSALNDLVYLFNPNVAESGEAIIDEENDGLSRYNYNLLHHTDDIPYIVVRTAVDCEVSVFIKYAHLYREDDKVTKAKHPEMTIFTYSKLLHDLYRGLEQTELFFPENSESPLMTLCVEIALFVTLPNKAIFERDVKEYIEILGQCELITNIQIAQIIATFIVHPRNYMHWQQFATFEHPSLDNRKLEYLQDQLVYQCGDNMVDYRGAQRDFINVPTPILDRNTKSRYLINIYLWGKGDEEFFGLIPVDDYRDDDYPYYGLRGSVGITGGRKRTILRAGGFKSDECAGRAPDCNHAAITKDRRNVLVHPLDAHLTGDWLNIVIDFEVNSFSFYKNGVFQAEVRDQIPDGDLFLVSAPDTPVDKYYIEEEVDQMIFERIAS